MVTSDASCQTARRRWPAEWEPHSGTIVLWPHNPGTFRVAKAVKSFSALIHHIAASSDERVHVLMPQHEEDVALLDTLKTCDNINIHVCPSNDSWARDTAPTFIVLQELEKDQVLGIDWEFNGYGGPNDDSCCYWPCPLDQGIALRTNQLLKVRHEEPRLILEGGSIHTDGEGTILTTKECLLRRNPNLSQSKIESILLQTTGCHTVLWLEKGLAFDEDTNGHVDNWCCFIQPGMVALAWTDDAKNDEENYHRCRQAHEQLVEWNMKQIHKLYLPTPLYYTKEIVDSLQFGDYNGSTVFPRQVGERMAASYVNFYIANTIVAVPQFGDVKADKVALDTLRPLFPDRRCVGIDSLEILIGGGNLHCVTQQVPKIGNSNSECSSIGVP